MIDRAEGAAFNHHFIVLRVRELWNTNDYYIAIHRMDTRDIVEFYEYGHEAVWDHKIRNPTNPVAHVEFETAGKRPLMLDYLFPTLKHMVMERYQLLTNNCQHFAAGILKTILNAGFYLETCKDWDAICELELDNKKWHRPDHPKLTMWQRTKCNSFLCGCGKLAFRSSMGVILPLSIILAAYTTAEAVQDAKEYRRALELIYQPIDNDYKANLDRQAYY